MRVLKTSRSLVAVLGVAVLGLTACGDDSEDTEAGGDDTGEEAEEDRGTLEICTDAPYEPFEFQDDDGNWTGFDMELMREIADRMNMDISVNVLEFDGIWLAPAAGSCDIVASAMTITEERAQNALFSDPYFDADQSLLVRAEDADTYATLDDLAGETIGVQSGTTGETYAEDNLPEGSTIQSFTEEGPIFLALESGEVAGVVQDLPVNGYRATQNEDLVVVETYATGEQYGFAAAPDNQELIDDVNQALADIREDGTYDQIHAEWFGEVAE